MTLAITAEAEARFWPKVDRGADSDCWPWKAWSNDHGYGTFYDGTRTVRAHRFAYELLVGPIPVGLTIDHLCRNTSCVNPSHLEPVTQAENHARWVATLRTRPPATHCFRGHRMDAENTYLAPEGRRRCHECRRITKGQKRAAA